MPGAAIGYLVICVMAGLVSLGYAVYQRIRLQASADWLQSPGTITKSELIRSDTSDSVEYSVAVLYDYVANGSRYTGNRIEFGRRGFARKKRAEAELERYPVNCAVTVYFNPDQPDDCVLVRSVPYNTMYFVLGILMLAVAFGIVVFSAIRA